MKKKVMYTLILNYIALLICILIAIFNNLSFKEFISRFLVLIISINTALYIFINIFSKNISKSQNQSNIDIAIPPIESELKDILNDFKEETGYEDEEFKELNFKDLKN